MRRTSLRIALVVVFVGAGLSSIVACGSSDGIDGRYLVFDSNATDLVPGDTNGEWDVFVRDRVDGTTERVSVGVRAEPPGSGYSPDARRLPIHEHVASATYGVLTEVRVARHQVAGGRRERDVAAVGAQRRRTAQEAVGCGADQLDDSGRPVTEVHLGD